MRSFTVTFAMALPFVAGCVATSTVLTLRSNDHAPADPQAIVSVLAQLAPKFGYIAETETTFPIELHDGSIVLAQFHYGREVHRSIVTVSVGADHTVKVVATDYIPDKGPPPDIQSLVAQVRSQLDKLLPGHSAEVEVVSARKLHP